MQKSLFPQLSSCYGGSLSRGKRKIARPLARKRPMHFVLKARESLLYANRLLLESELRRLSSKFGLRVYSIAVNFDHVHFTAVLPGRREYVGFIRALTGILARKFGKGVWRVLPYSRALTWGRDFRATQAYLQKNREEAAGISL